MLLPEKVTKRNLLQYAESIGGKHMYLSMIHAIHDANVQGKPVFSRKQLGNVIRKLVSSGDYNITREGIQKLIIEKERRRQAYIKMAIESENDEQGPSLYGGMQAGAGRYDFRQAVHGRQGATGRGAVSSISSLNKIGRPQNNVGSALRPKATAVGVTAPRTSIAHYKI